MFAFVAGVLFVVSAIVYAVHAHEWGSSFLFWALLGFAAWAFHYAFTWYVAYRKGAVPPVA